MRALVVALLLTAAPLASARPGGGSHYSSGSRGSSSSGHFYGGHGLASSSGEGGDPTGILIALGILVVAAAIILIARNQGVRRERAQVQMSAASRERAIAELRGHDPTFVEERFAQRTLVVMSRINEAWLRGDMGPARALTSDGIYVRFSTQLALLKAGGLKNVMADWRAVSAEIAAAQSDATWDTVHVKVVGVARDRDVPITLSPADQEARAKGAPLEQYEEVWSFVRRRGKRTPEGAFTGAIDGKCASCGAELPLSDVVRCQFCKALTNSGEHDWVLAEITQPEEFDATDAAADVPGLEAIRARDPALSRQELEDRASVMFWKWIEARVTGQRKKLDRFCREAGVVDAPRAALTEVAVGSCDAAQAAADPDGFDRVRVDLRFSARQDGNDPVNSLHRLTLVRSSKAVSQHGLSSLDCPNCGGPLAGSDDVKCRYCGETLTGGDRDWALESIRALG